MVETQPKLDQWQRLYALAAQFRSMAPWQWMEEVDLFGVQNPQTGETGFVSVMGMLGEHFAVALYLGLAGLYGFWDMAHAGPDEVPERLLEVPQLQVSFENREELMRQDREVIKELGLKFRGPQAWPLFRSFRPGFFPWLLEAEEADFLGWALEQLLEVAPRFRENRELRKDLHRGRFLVRVPERGGDALAWHDEIRQVPPPEAMPIHLEISRELLAACRRLSQGDFRVEADLSPAPFRIGKPGERPQLGYVLMSVESGSGFILGTDVLAVETSLEAMYGEVPSKLLRHFLVFGKLPHTVAVRSSTLAQLLAPVAAELHFGVKKVRRLPALASVQSRMERFVGR